MPNDDIASTAKALLKVSWKCQGHCKEMATTEFLKDGMIAAQVCPSRYVSRIIAFRKQPDLESVRQFIQATTQKLGTVEKADVRVGSRYAWDLGLDRKSDDLILREIYWTQNYRRTKSDAPDRLALFLCSNGDSFFVQPLTSTSTLCENCRRKM
jgi:hypothetical protein